MKIIPSTKFERSMRQPQGFSLVELLVVIAIIGILAGLAIPALANLFENSSEQCYRRNAQHIASMYNAARMTGVQLPAGDDIPNVVSVLASGVTGTSNNITYRFSPISPDQIAGAQRFLHWQPSAGLLQYTGADYQPPIVN